MPPALQTATPDSSFASTRWTVVRQAADSQTASQHASSALSELCQIYWRAVYVFLRRQGIPQHDAQDLTQGFFRSSPCSSWRRRCRRWSSAREHEWIRVQVKLVQRAVRVCAIAVRVVRPHRVELARERGQRLRRRWRIRRRRKYQRQTRDSNALRTTRSTKRNTLMYE
jgi:hypothetical protein